MSCSIHIVLITGVSDDSIAGELAVQLSTAKLKLLILSVRAESKVRPIISKIKETKPNVETRFLNIELANLNIIRQAVENDLAHVSKIDHVVCTAGVMACPFGRTKDGFKIQFRVN